LSSVSLSLSLSLSATSRYAQLSKTISDHKDEIKLLKDKEKDLRDTIRNLDKDILVRNVSIVEISPP
jgi:cell division protein FtsB